MALATDIQALSGGKFDLPLGGDYLFPVYAEFGIYRHDHGSGSEEERLQALRDWVAFAPDTPRSSGVFMDNMSLYSAFSLVTDWDGQIPANVLLDLDTFVRCVVLYDHIFYISNTAELSEQSGRFDFRRLNKLLGNERVAVPIPADPESYNRGVWGALSDLFDQAEVELYRMTGTAAGTTAATDREAIRRGWEIVLGRPIAINDIYDQGFAISYWPSSGETLVQNLLTIVPDENVLFTGLETPSRFITESNARSLFNTRVAGILNLPYAANTTRMPFRAHLLSNAAVAQDAMQDVREIQEIFSQFAAGYLRPESVELPIFLTAVLARTRTLGGFFAEVAGLRAQAAGYRAHRRELLDAIQARNATTIDKLRLAVLDDAHKLRGAVAGSSSTVVLGVLAALGHGFAPLIIAGLQAMLGVDEEKRRILGRRLFKPEEWFVTRVSGSARELLDARPAIERLWGPMNWDYMSGRFHDIVALDDIWPGSKI